MILIPFRSVSSPRPGLTLPDFLNYLTLCPYHCQDDWRAGCGCVSGATRCGVTPPSRRLSRGRLALDVGARCPPHSRQDAGGTTRISLPRAPPSTTTWDSAVRGGRGGNAQGGTRIPAPPNTATPTGTRWLTEVGRECYRLSREAVPCPLRLPILYVRRRHWKSSRAGKAGQHRRRRREQL
jgi:hypothetical protein